MQCYHIFTSSKLSVVTSYHRFRRLEQFTNLDILSDYRLLEEISRDNESKKRKPRYRNKESKKTRLKDNVRQCETM